MNREYESTVSGKGSREKKQKITGQSFTSFRSYIVLRYYHKFLDVYVVMDIVWVILILSKESINFTTTEGTGIN